MGIIDSRFRPVALIVFLDFFFFFFFNGNPLFFSHFQKLRGRGNIFVFLVNLDTSLVCKFKLLSAYSLLKVLIQ